MTGNRIPRLLLLLAFPLLLAGCSAGVIPAVHSEAERLSEARHAMDQREYNVAIELLKTYIANNAGSKEVDDAVYRLGMCYLKIREYPTAQVEFERLLRDYPESDSAASAAFRLGDALWGQTRAADFDQEFSQKALDQWESYLHAYPGHWLNANCRHNIEVARTRLAKRLVDVGTLYLKLNLPNPARAYFQMTTDHYADTVPVFEARLGLALCDARLGHRQDAIAKLKPLVADCPIPEVHQRAARELAKLERHSG